jgi:hypothetical protein
MIGTVFLGIEDISNHNHEDVDMQIQNTRVS